MARIAVIVRTIRIPCQDLLARTSQNSWLGLESSTRGPKRVNVLRPSMQSQRASCDSQHPGEVLGCYQVTRMLLGFLIIIRAVVARKSQLGCQDSTNCYRGASILKEPLLDGPLFKQRPFFQQGGEILLAREIVVALYDDFLGESGRLGSCELLGLLVTQERRSSTISSPRITQFCRFAFAVLTHSIIYGRQAHQT